jgi:8-hydroxy-5-deazaflavin:NADPH oxidoreductase
MRIGVIGTGNMGRALGRLLSQQGHQVMIGSRDGARGAKAARDAGGNASAGTIRDAAESGEAILLAVHFVAVPQVLSDAGQMEGKIIMDCTNPLAPDFMALTIGHTTSAAEQIAALAPKASVIKVFNHNLSQALSQPRHGELPAAAFYCGDDPVAKEKVAALVRGMAFDAVDAGPLESARYLEPMAQLLIRLAYVQGMGPSVGMALLRR